MQRDIFVIGLNDTFRRFRSDIICREDLTSLTFAQAISKARDFEANIQTDSAITQQHLEEGAHKVTPTGDKPKLPFRPPRRPTHPASGITHSNTCIWCGRASHPTRRECPASNDTCHGCGKRGHWQQVFGLRRRRWYLMWTRIPPATLNPLTLSPMMYAKSRLHQRASLLTLTLALLQSHHHLPNGSDSRLTRVVPATLYMPQTSTSSLQHKWTRLLFVSLITQRESSQPQGKLLYSALAVGNHTRLLSKSSLRNTTIPLS